MNPSLDLELTRLIAASPAALYRCWTDPALLVQWFCPPPYRVVDADVEAKPGGAFHTVMEGPNGDRFDEGAGCVLIAEPGRRFAFTDAMGPGYRPKSKPFITAVLSFEAVSEGTRYRALVQHASTADRKRHEGMGFFKGWGIATDQLAALAETL